MEKNRVSLLNQSLTQSLAQLIWCAGNRSFSFGTIKLVKNCIYVCYVLIKASYLLTYLFFLCSSLFLRFRMMYRK